MMLLFWSAWVCLETTVTLASKVHQAIQELLGRKETKVLLVQQAQTVTLEQLATQAHRGVREILDLRALRATQELREELETLVSETQVFRVLLGTQASKATKETLALLETQDLKET